MDGALPRDGMLFPEEECAIAPPACPIRNAPMPTCGADKAKALALLPFNFFLG